MEALPALAWAFGLAAGVFVLHRLAVWMEARGWIHYRRGRGHAATGAALLELQALLQPEARALVETVRGTGEAEEADGKGDT